MKRLLILTLMTALLSAVVFAQSLPSTGGGGFTSPQSTATQGRIRSDADNFIRPDSYSGVKFENWYGVASFAATGKATLGYAAKVNESVYLGLFYSGTFLANLPTLTSIETTAPWLGTPNKSGVTVFETLPSLTSPNPLNQIAVLIGLEEMGFRFSFTSTYNNITQNDFLVADTGNQYKYLEIGSGWLAPQIAWSMAKNLTENGVKPWATLEVAFSNDYRKSQQYNGASAGDERVARSMNFTQPELNIGLGSITVHNNNSWRTSFDAEYRLQLQIYDNEYDSNGKISNIKGRNDGNFFNPIFDEYEYSYHRLLPSLTTQWNGEKLRLRARIELPLTLANTVITPKTVSGSSLETGGTTSNELDIGIAPVLVLAAQWQAASKLFINAGGRVSFSGVNIKTTEGDFYAGTTKGDSYKTTSTEFGTTITNNLTLGVTFNATENLSFEAASGVSNSSSNNINVFESGANGLFVFSSILATLRF